jgi:hypothetical protein
MAKINRKIKKLAISSALSIVLLEDGPMNMSLYKYDMEENIAYWTESMRKDKNDLVFVVNENNGHIAMVLINRAEELFINEEARAYLQKVWKENYVRNVKMLLPGMVEDLLEGIFPFHGVTVMGR